MNTLLTASTVASAALLVGWAGFASAAPDAQTSGGCCGGGMMAGMMGQMGDGAHDGHAAEKVKLTAAQQKSVDDLTTAYLSAQKKLAADSVDGLAGDFERMHESAHGLAASADGDLKAAADRLATAAHDAPDTLDAARAAYKKVSAAVAELARLAPPSDAAAGSLYEMTCPMAKASWLQTSVEIANPYMGQAMSTCGTVKATVKAE